MRDRYKPLLGGPLAAGLLTHLYQLRGGIVINREIKTLSSPPQELVNAARHLNICVLRVVLLIPGLVMANDGNQDLVSSPK